MVEAVAQEEPHVPEEDALEGCIHARKAPHLDLPDRCAQHDEGQQPERAAPHTAADQISGRQSCKARDSAYQTARELRGESGQQSQQRDDVLVTQATGVETATGKFRQPGRKDVIDRAGQIELIDAKGPDAQACKPSIETEDQGNEQDPEQRAPNPIARQAARTGPNPFAHGINRAALAWISCASRAAFCREWWALT